jgi:hypothetical protein
MNMYRSKYPIVVLLLCAGIIVFTGCGDKRPPTARVSGRVTYQGRPVPEGKIIFIPEQGRPAIGELGPDGQYELKTFIAGDGALVGKHRVTIEARRVSGGAKPKTIEEELHGGGGASPPTNFSIQWLVPEKYANPDTSPLTAEIKSGENVLNFDL